MSRQGQGMDRARQARLALCLPALCFPLVATPAWACGGMEDKFKVVAVAPGASDDWPVGSYLCVDATVTLGAGEFIYLRNDKDIMLQLRGPGRRKVAIAERRPATLWGTISNVLDPRFWGLENKHKAAVRFTGDKDMGSKFA